MAPGNQPLPVNRRSKKQKHRRAIQAKKGDAWLADKDYVPRATRMEGQAWVKRLEKAIRYFDDVPSDSVPMDCQWEALSQNDPQKDSRWGSIAGQQEGRPAAQPHHMVQWP